MIFNSSNYFFDTPEDQKKESTSLVEAGQPSLLARLMDGESRAARGARKIWLCLDKLLFF